MPIDDSICTFHICDGDIEWKPFDGKEPLCTHFSIDKWHKIISGIDSDEEWRQYLNNHIGYVQCFLLSKCSNNRPIGFLFICQEDEKGLVVSVHGGGWENSLTLYRGYILILKHLLEQGIKIRTYCQLSNTAAIRFSRSVGFVPYRYTETTVHMWINERRLKNSLIYKRLR